MTRVPPLVQCLYVMLVPATLYLMTTIDNTIYHTVNITKESTIVHTVYNTMDRYYNNNVTIIS